MRNSFLILSIALMSVLAIGCEKPAANNSGTEMAEALASGDHGHSHDDDHHGHSHAEHSHDEHGHDDHGHAAHIEEMGPNKGHIIRLEPTDYVAEWRHYKGNSVIRVYVLNEHKKTVPVNATVSIASDSGKSQEKFELVPEDADGEGKTGVYMLDEQALAMAMNLGVEISFEIDGKMYKGKVPPHKPHHH